MRMLVLLALSALVSGCLATGSGFVQGLSSSQMSAYESQRLQIEREKMLWAVINRR